MEKGNGKIGKNILFVLLLPTLIFPNRIRDVERMWVIPKQKYQIN